MRGLGFVAAFVLAAGLIGAGCQSTHEEGVKSNMHTQWTNVSADVKATTDAAKAVLEEEGLKDVKADATNMDGKASAKMADGTKVTATVAKKGDKMSEVSVNVGTMGSPTRGAELAKKIKMRAEGNRM
jgi:hypothetical protein